jgi:hypothetical protein
MKDTSNVFNFSLLHFCGGKCVSIGWRKCRGSDDGQTYLINIRTLLRKIITRSSNGVH